MPDIRHAIEPEEMMAYLDGELPAALAAEAMTHLERCVRCQKLAADLQRVSQEMATWEVEPPRAMAAPIVEPERRKWTLRSAIPVPVYAIALASCLVIGLMVVVSPKINRQSASFARLSVADQLPRNSAVEEKWTPLPPAVTVSRALPAPPPQSTPTPAAGPMIERTATIDLAARDFDQLRGRIDSLLARRHGYLAELTVNAPQGAGRSLSATLRIPAAELDAALTELRQLGRVENELQKGEDVTRAYADLVARLANARSTEQRLAQMLAQRTGKLTDVLEVEREISRVRGEIEQMEAERHTTADQVVFATVQLNAREDYQAQLRLSPDSTLARFRNALVDGYKNLVGGLVGVALALITYGPAVLLWVTLALLVGLWLIRRRKSPGSQPGS
ncbi:MAG: DUF4349 domain-containing protein [Bryobacteraceae bacterium]